MGKIYVNQSKLRLQLNTGVDIASDDMLEIQYTKPGSTTVESFPALELEGTPGAIYYDFAIGDLDVAGTWTFWAFITFGQESDSLSAPGEPVRIKVFEVGGTCI
jgi:hypothetical protein